MKLPPLHNTRVPAQWEIISHHIDFEGKTVLDLGCGYGDLLFRCWQAGAIDCLGVDKETHHKVFEIATNWLMEDIGTTDFDLNTELFKIPKSSIRDEWGFRNKWDVVICFSVLPYLDNPIDVSRWIRDNSKIALIECQYANDGPGFPEIQDDRDFEAFLIGCGFQSAKSIGRTLVEGRNKWRTIWLCQ